jgi:hypothetical protein
LCPRGNMHFNYPQSVGNKNLPTLRAAPGYLNG